ncbi:hypothetical protein DdX_06659 [Ditylenchus destructor]|uniref:Uncharacterized protein n=1 Tax=Ditylenchus destructor TaxID=166010 RepID=A0AAD4NAU0_9BILA|nr:hypothetical protein DdX_06659 [Ditylenchus destructor]
MPYAPTRNISKLRREKRRNRASDDMVDCQSLADIEFCVDPRIPRRKVNPYDSATDSLLVKQSKRKKRKFKNCPVVRKWSKYSERMYIERSNSEAKDGEQYHIRLGCRSSLCMLSEHSTNTDFDQSILALRDRDQHYNHLERHCSIGYFLLAV